MLDYIKWVTPRISGNSFLLFTLSTSLVTNPSKTLWDCSQLFLFMHNSLGGPPITAFVSDPR